MVPTNAAATWRGLDNAGKTTIVKKIMNEDVSTVSPTLGFIIKTVDYEGYVSQELLRRARRD
jgi:ADP-ribosylation factor-like protein 2